MSAPDPLPRVLPDSAAQGPCAAGLPDGTPHPDPFLAARGWQVIAGVYVRVSPAASEEPAA